MKRKLLIGVAVLAVVAIFFFAPIIREEWGSFAPGGSDTVGWVSPSFALFQCGAFVGGVDIGMPNGSAAGMPEPFWVASSNWNCQYPHWMG